MIYKGIPSLSIKIVQSLPNAEKVGVITPHYHYDQNIFMLKRSKCIASVLPRLFKDSGPLSRKHISNYALCSVIVSSLESSTPAS